METRTKKMLKVGKVVGWSFGAVLFLGFFGTAMTGIVSLGHRLDAASCVIGFGSVALVMGLFGYSFYLEEYRGHDFTVKSSGRPSPQRSSAPSNADTNLALGMLTGMEVNRELGNIANTINPPIGY